MKEIYTDIDNTLTNKVIMVEHYKELASSNKQLIEEMSQALQKYSEGQNNSRELVIDTYAKFFDQQNFNDIKNQVYDWLTNSDLLNNFAKSELLKPDKEITLVTANPDFVAYAFADYIQDRYKVKVTNILCSEMNYTNDWRLKNIDGSFVKRIIDKAKDVEDSIQDRPYENIIAIGDHPKDDLEFLKLIAENGGHAISIGDRIEKESIAKNHSSINPNLKL
jgi:hypothetical protein